MIEQDRVERLNTLYRFYDAGESLLYIGITNNPGRRLEQHSATKSWWCDGMGLHLLCSSCVARYPGFRDATEFRWNDGKPVLR